MERALKAVLSTADLSLAELCSARLDGELYSVDECFSPVDECPSRAQRAAAAASVVPREASPELATAAWIHGALASPPERHTFFVDIAHRVGNLISIAFTVRERRRPAVECVRVGGLELTSPAQTAVDLLRADRFDRSDREVVARLLDVGGICPRECARLISTQPSNAGNPRARERLRLWIGG